jgi:hypothetical protein
MKCNNNNDDHVNDDVRDGDDEQGVHGGGDDLR